jgi:hypothetical protein
VLSVWVIGMDILLAETYAGLGFRKSVLKSYSVLMLLLYSIFASIKGLINLGDETASVEFGFSLISALI